jgi:hypothetical protein
MSSEEEAKKEEVKEDWYDRDKKRDAILRVLRHVLQNPQDGKQALNDETKARELFESHGQIKVPQDARTIFFESGEKNLKEGSSVIIELPADGTSPNLPDQVLMKYVLGNYQHW